MTAEGKGSSSKHTAILNIEVTMKDGVTPQVKSVRVGAAAVCTLDALHHAIAAAFAIPPSAIHGLQYRHGRKSRMRPLQSEDDAAQLLRTDLLPPRTRGGGGGEKTYQANFTTTPPPLSGGSFDPCVAALLAGIHLSRRSPLRVLRRDLDAAALVIAAFRAARARHVDWSAPQQRGLRAGLFRVEFPPPLVRSQRGRAASTATAARDFSEARLPADGGAAAAAAEMRGMWRDLARWAVAEDLVDAADAPVWSIDDDSNIDAAAAAERISRAQQRLVAALGERVEPFHVNMLPVVMGRAGSLPLKCKRYSSMINACLARCPGEKFKVGYLTIHEGFVEPGETQRRPGLHVETPSCYQMSEGEGGVRGGQPKIIHVAWGGGTIESTRQIVGGVFQASNTPNSSRAWDCVLRDPAGIAGPHGDIEHLRHLLDRGPPKRAATGDLFPWMNGRNFRPYGGSAGARRGGPRMLEAKTMTWMTDRTPHESVAVAHGGGRVFRQYFRLVTSRVTVWYVAHSTRNDECEVRPPARVMVVAEDKFAAAAASGSGSGVVVVGEGREGDGGAADGAMAGTVRRSKAPLAFSVNLMRLPPPPGCLG
ncbi:hypothetical protein DFJ73DRAFT_957778 [Zopfochytrium polystomum]|nr:hypothetical protein DFJ73DRAFT_957778 [Zopfochytrium polystomum]